MEAILKDLDRLESRMEGDAVTVETLQAGIDALERWRDALMAGEGGDDSKMQEDDNEEESSLAETAAREVAICATKMTESNKEWFSSMTKFSKSVDKKFNGDLAPLLTVPKPGAANEDEEDEDLYVFFPSEESKETIDNVIAMHLARTGDEEVSKEFLDESGITLPLEDMRHFSTLRKITDAIVEGDLAPAFQWVEDHRGYLQKQQSDLEYHLHRSQYVRLLLSDSAPLPSSLQDSTYVTSTSNMADKSAPTTSASQGGRRALSYARQHFQQFYPRHLAGISRLAASAIYLPLSRLCSSPYADLFLSDVMELEETSPEDTLIDSANNVYHAPHLVELFSSEFCSSLNMPKDLPLRVVTDIGGGGDGLANILKLRAVMKNKRTNWTTTSEMPVEISVPQEYRYHSVFCCPVAKEQATLSNPPMMMPCGHTVAKQSLLKLSKGGQNVRCPYCPLSSAVNQAIQLTF